MDRFTIPEFLSPLGNLLNRRDSRSQSHSNSQSRQNSRRNVPQPRPNFGPSQTPPQPERQAPAAAPSRSASSDDFKGPPPAASSKAMRQIPEVCVTLEDLVEESNKCCCICLDDHELSEVVCRLPCAHIFHKVCIMDWLSRNCTCPSCRYELESSNTAFEAGRRLRMQGRKFRFRKQELELSTVSRLRSIAADLSVPTEGCLEKSDLIGCIILSERVEIYEVRLPEYSLTHLNSISIRELKDLMARYGVLYTGCIEKSDLIAHLANSGRVAVIEEQDSSTVSYSCHEKVHYSYLEEVNEAEDNFNDVQKKILQAQSLKALKAIMLEERIDLSGCLEKDDMVDKILNARACTQRH